MVGWLPLRAANERTAAEEFEQTWGKEQGGRKRRKSGFGVLGGAGGGGEGCRGVMMMDRRGEWGSPRRRGVKIGSHLSPDTRPPPLCPFIPSLVLLPSSFLPLSPLDIPYSPFFSLLPRSLSASTAAALKTATTTLGNTGEHKITQN